MHMPGKVRNLWNLHNIQIQYPNTDVLKNNFRTLLFFFSFHSLFFSESLLFRFCFFFTIYDIYIYIYIFFFFYKFLIKKNKFFINYFIFFFIFFLLLFLKKKILFFIIKREINFC